ncbi:nitronate monooxygenase [Bacillus vallismortis]|uniref:Probable nitronate monooxygenase n=1 Tax=Bacillus vallismortis TaxID=72361 RepID=A0ABY4XW41_BACVA|nr:MULTISPECIES: nitronate monooxygenase [Bacillus]MBL3648385.1 nitronate monooxygenase [Bacillus sp. RHFS10]USP94579.1 nitronate monooxygenase [Bacillus vallismortis]
MTEWMKLLSLTKPVIQAPMAGGLVTPVLAAAVSNEGALGSLASGYLSSDMLEKQIVDMQQLTDGAFQVNVFVPESRKEPDEGNIQTWKNRIPFAEQAPPFSSEEEEWEDFHKKISIILKHNVRACSFTFGIPPDETIQALKKNGCCLIGTATVPQEAIMLEERGMDIIVLQGSEAGGHRGSFLPVSGEAALGLMSLIPQAADAVSVPVIAAGGIADRRGVQAAHCLGAQGVQVGTPFLMCEQCEASETYKGELKRARGTDTRLTSLFSGKPARGIVNQWMKEQQAEEANALPYPLQNTLTKPMRKQAAREKDSGYMSLWAGQSVGMLNGTADVKSLLAELCRT